MDPYTRPEFYAPPRPVVCNRARPARSPQENSVNCAFPGALARGELTRVRHLEIADLIGRGAAAQNPECWDLAVKESSDSEPRRGAGEAEGEGGGWVQKKCAPRSIVFSSRFARARVSLSCESALPCSGRRCVCANVSLVSVGAPRHVPALPAWGKTPGCPAARTTCAFGGL